MNKIFTLLCLFTVFFVKAQNIPSATTLKVQAAPSAFKTPQPYGKVDLEDLQMKTCDFEPDANAEVLFDKASEISSGNIVSERHVRIKIFNDFGKNAANVRLEFFPNAISSVNIQAETINLVDGKIEFTPVDKKSVYTEKVDISRSALVFTFPNVKAGSIIEYKYSVYDQYFNIWPFQNNFPTRYSEIETVFSTGQDFKVIPHVKQSFVVDKGFNDDAKQVKALINVHSLPDEPYMSGRLDNLQRMEYLIFDKVPLTWIKIGKRFLSAPDFGDQLERAISGEEEFVKQAKLLSSKDEKIAYIFDKVKNEMKWNDILLFYSTIGSVAAWDKKTGNSTEINMILYRLLKKAGVKVYPIIVGNGRSGKINPVNPSLFHFASMDLYVPVDSVKSYILDASNKFNLFNAIPTNVLNTFGLLIDAKDDNFQTIFLEDTDPAIQSVFLNAEIKPEGKISGTAEINSYSYNKINAAGKYKTDGEEKYIKFLTNNDNTIHVSSLKLEAMDVDTLPLTQKFEFNISLTGSDENYIYFNTNLFTQLGDNPFKKEERYSDIDFGYRANYSINGIYKLPAAYKTDALPKSVTLVMPDQSIVFKRIVAEDNGTVLVKYTLNHKKTIYFREDYQEIRSFYKKMYEMLNEQIVLKKI